MNDVDTQLSALFDEIAASIDPKPDFDGVVSSTIVPRPPSGHSRRPVRQGLAVAAAVVVVLGGAAAAFQLDDEPSLVATDDVTAPTTTEAERSVASAGASDGEVRTATTPPAHAAEKPDVGVATVARTAVLGAGRLDTDPIRQIVHGRAAVGERVTVSTPYGGGDAVAGAEGRWKVVLELAAVPAATLVPLEVGFEDGTVIELTIVTPAPAPEPTTPTTLASEQPKPEPEPKPEPKPEPAPEPPPAPVPFTAALGTGHLDATPMKQVVYGTATPGTKVLVTTAYGHVTAEAGAGGQWEAHLAMYEVPAGTGVRIAVSASGFAEQYEFWVQRPQAESKPFTAEIAGTHLDGDPIKVVFHGTGTPGSKVTASSEYGTVETHVGEAGAWEMKLRMHGVPSGATVGIRISDSATGAVQEFSVTKSAAPAPDYHFKANAAFAECDATPTYNEYWGQAAPGSIVTISSPYGGTQVTVDGAGNWEARVEFPDAPIGETFQVLLTNSANDHTFTFGLKRIAPI